MTDTTPSAAERSWLVTRESLTGAIATMPMPGIPKLGAVTPGELVDHLAGGITGQPRVTHYHHPPVCDQPVRAGEMWSGRDDNVTCVACIVAAARAVGRAAESERLEPVIAAARLVAANADGTKPRHTRARDGGCRDDCIPCGLEALRAAVAGLLDGPP